MMIRCFLFLLLSLWCTGVRAQVALVNQKGTVLSVDSSKWKLTDTNIYNKNTGNVGIGTNAAPNSSAVLEVKSASKGLLIPRIALTAVTAAAPLGAHVAGMIVYNTATAGTAPNNVSPGFYFNNGTKWVKASDILQADTTNDAWVNDNTNTMVKLATKSDAVTARDTGTEFVIKDNGRVGIGTSNPAWLLDVQGSNAIGHFKRFSSSGSTTGPAFLFTRSRGTIAGETDVVNGDALGKIQFRARISGSDLDITSLSYFIDDKTTNEGHFAFTKSDLLTEVMTVKTVSGNVGIGNTSPAYKLDVKGQAHADSTISAPNYTATVQTITGTWNLNLGANASWTLAAGANALTITNAKTGMFGLLKVTNAGTSTITLPTGSKVINGGAGAVLLTQTASAVDILTFYYDGTNYWWTYGNNYN